MNYFNLLLLLSLSVIFQSCQTTEEQTSNLTLQPVSVAEFQAFVNATNYITDAEKYGWSIYQLDVYNFTVRQDANWRKPDSIHIAKANLPVTQVSYNDAQAYCKWAKVRLPNYEEYWDLTKNDIRTINTDNVSPILPVDSVNIIGNVWEITTSEDGNNQIRLAGGSLFCSKKTCYGIQKDRILHVDKETGNVHIGFAVVK